MNPIISIIVPIYNAEQYLTRCLDTMLAQDYSPIEIVLIDDGSTDGSGKICEDYAARLNNIHVLHISNGGASLARKKGIEIAQGDFLTFVDSDDYVAPNYVSSMYSLISKFDTKISACGVKRVLANPNDNLNPNFKLDDSRNENGNEDKKGGEKVKVKVNVEETVSVEDLLLSFENLMPRFFKYEFWGFPGCLYHRSVFEGLMFPKATLSEDYYVKTQMFCRERQMAVTNAPLYFYEYHPTSLSHTKISERAFEEFENVKAVYDYTIIHCPEYGNYALSNVVETAVKLCLMDCGSSFDGYVNNIHSFLKQHNTEIYKLKMLNRNTRFLACCMAIAPFTRRILCRIM